MVEKDHGQIFPTVIEPSAPIINQRYDNHADISIHLKNAHIFQLFESLQPVIC